MTTVCARNDRMGIREYFESIFTILRSPAKYFESVADEQGWRRALFFLMISGIFYCSVSMTYFFEHSLAMGVVMMANAVIMPALGAVFTFMLLSMTGDHKPYFKIFNIFAYASGAVMVVSWIPGLAVIMEPVRAVLIGIGLVKVCGTGKIKAALVVVLTAALLLIFFWSTAPVVMGIRDMLAGA